LWAVDRHCQITNNQSNDSVSRPAPVVRLRISINQAGKRDIASTAKAYRQNTQATKMIVKIVRGKASLADPFNDLNFESLPAWACRPPANILIIMGDTRAIVMIF
jgi:hypothetical protein